jgi:hypothetical protein
LQQIAFRTETSVARFFPESALARITARLSHFFHILTPQPRLEAREPETMSDELERTLIAREARNRY